MAIIKDLFTSKDGESFNFTKVMGFIAIFVFMGLSFYSYLFLKNVFDVATWGGTLSALIGTISSMIRITHVTEPDGNS